MRKVEFAYLEIINNTEQLIIFVTTFNKKSYGADIILNTALPVEVQDVQIRKVIKKLETMKAKDVKEAILCRQF